MQDPNPTYNRGEDFNQTVEDIHEVARHALAMADKTSLTECMNTICQMCDKTQTDRVD